MSDSRAIILHIKGIKCDNRACGWSDMGVDFDPDYYLDMPCPQCGSNLFTPADYKAMMRIFRFTRLINRILQPFMWLFGKRLKRVAHEVEMNGSGNVKITTKESA